MNNFYEQRWLAIKKLLDDRGVNGSDIVEALQDYYSIFEDRTLKWLAGLFDPDIGGFYYSESARDNDAIVYNGVEYPLLPDIESTSQATNFLHSNEIYMDWMDFPLWMRKKMEKFICERQDPETGFFYHPQWPKALTDSKPHRRGRDLRWSVAMADKYKFKLPYPTAYERLENKDEEAEMHIPEYLLNEEKFLSYLKNFDWENKAYWSGNQIASQAKIIRASGLAKVAVNFMNSIQNPKNGCWGRHENGFCAINAFLKISAMYGELGFPVPNADKAIKVAFECTTEPTEAADSVCCQYNAWFSIRNILDSMRTFGGLEGNCLAEEAIDYHLKNCLEPISSTKEKALRFKKADGSFSFNPTESSGLSQGMPVAIFHTNEGDINANGICSSGTARQLFASLGIEENFIPIFSPAKTEIFNSVLKLPKEMQ